ncbi:unnamed protein product [Caenorhabditis auriculariae]|uniref:Reverse transcriptase domain-containing protein n=1 Tax=Caenorhabditis auriculariae TaxID=2777116 RepID=A0A8S1H0X4_9PELO|nr:unnamed protein product [Caenorhabditis auriculariae]
MLLEDLEEALSHLQRRDRHPGADVTYSLTLDYVIADRRCPIYDVDVIANFQYITDHRLIRAKMKLSSRHVNKRATSKRVFHKSLFAYAVEQISNEHRPHTNVISLCRKTNTPSGRLEFCLTNKALRISIKDDIERRRHSKIDNAIEKHRSVLKVMKESQVCSTALTQPQREDGTIAASKKMSRKLFSSSIILYTSLDSSPALVLPSQEDFPPILADKVRAALKKAKKKQKLLGRIWSLRRCFACEDIVVPHLVTIFNESLVNERAPHSRPDSVVRLLHKKGNCLDIGNYRPVALLSVVYKLFTSILRRRATQNTLVVTEMIQKSQKYKFPLYLMFVDYKKAFDSVEFGSLWTALSECGVHSED